MGMRTASVWTRVLLPVSFLVATACGAESPVTQPKAVAPAPATSPTTQPCLPSRLAVVPATVRVGGKVVLSAAAFTCSAKYEPGKTYTVTLGLVGRSEPKALGSVPVNEDGSFKATLSIPADASPGLAYLSVGGSAFDNCGKSGDGSCAVYGSPPLTLTAP